MDLSNQATAFVIAVGIVVIIEFFVINHHKSLIRESLENRKANIIKIAWQPFDFDKSNHTYLVEYKDKKGQSNNRMCKIGYWNSTIYWVE